MILIFNCFISNESWPMPRPNGIKPMREHFLWTSHLFRLTTEYQSHVRVFDFIYWISITWDFNCLDLNACAMKGVRCWASITVLVICMCLCIPECCMSLRKNEDGRFFLCQPHPMMIAAMLAFHVHLIQSAFMFWDNYKRSVMPYRCAIGVNCVLRIFTFQQCRNYVD